MHFYIYSIRNKKNGRRLIEAATDLTGIAIHKNNSPNEELRRDIQKFGWENFWFEILDESADCYDEMYTRQMRLILQYNSFRDGYNENVGGDGDFVSDNIKEMVMYRINQENAYFDRIDGKKLYAKRASRKNPAKKASALLPHHVPQAVRVA